jgi:4-hydroxybenzoate polyprenyltransferase
LELRNSGRNLLQLVRAPNLLSVPGDPLAGCFLAIAASHSLSRMTVSVHEVPWAAMAVAALASVAAYAGGMVDNDLVDLERDRADRPERPLPSGAVGLPLARKLRGVFLASPFVLGAVARLPLAWFGVHLALLGSILAYNRVKEGERTAGFVLMGACRGFSLLSGAAIFGAGALLEHSVQLAFVVWTSYVAGLTAFASTENVRGPGRIRFLLLLPFGALAAVGPLPNTPLRTGTALAVAGLAGVLWTATSLLACGSGAEPKVVKHTVGRLIRVLVPMQACACLGTPGGEWAAVFLLGCWFVAGRLSRHYAAS